MGAGAVVWSKAACGCTIGKEAAWGLNAAPPGWAAPIRAARPTTAAARRIRSTKRKVTHGLSRGRNRGVAGCHPRPDGWSTDQELFQRDQGVGRHLGTQVEEGQGEPGKDEHAAADGARRRDAAEERQGKQRGQRGLPEEGDRNRRRVDV